MRLEIEEITPERAAEILRTQNTRNRPINKERVSSYVKELRSGEWTLTPQGIAFDKDGILVDGQHRLKAITIFAQPVEMSVAYDLTPQAAAKMDQGLPRTASHVLAAQGGQYSTRIAAAARSILVAQGLRSALLPTSIEGTEEPEVEAEEPAEVINPEVKPSRKRAQG